MLIQHSNKTVRVSEIIGFDENDETDARFTFTSDLHEYFTSDSYWDGDNPREHCLYFKFTLAIKQAKNAQMIAALFTEVLAGFVNMFREISAPQIVVDACPETGECKLTLNFVCLRAVGSKRPEQPVQEAE